MTSSNTELMLIIDRWAVAKYLTTNSTAKILPSVNSETKRPMGGRLYGAKISVEHYLYLFPYTVRPMLYRVWKLFRYLCPCYMAYINMDHTHIYCVWILCACVVVQTQAICNCCITTWAVIWSMSYYPNVSIFLLTALGGLLENTGTLCSYWVVYIIQVVWFNYVTLFQWKLSNNEVSPLNITSFGCSHKFIASNQCMKLWDAVVCRHIIANFHSQYALTASSFLQSMIAWLVLNLLKSCDTIAVLEWSTAFGAFPL